MKRSVRLCVILVCVCALTGLVAPIVAARSPLSSWSGEGVCSADGLAGAVAVAADATAYIGGAFTYVLPRAPLRVTFAILGVIVVGAVVVTLVRMRRETLETRRRKSREQRLVTPPAAPRDDPPPPPALRG